MDQLIKKKIEKYWKLKQISRNRYRLRRTTRGRYIVERVVAQTLDRIHPVLLSLRDSIRQALDNAAEPARTEILERSESFSDRLGPVLGYPKEYHSNRLLKLLMDIQEDYMDKKTICKDGLTTVKGRPSRRVITDTQREEAAYLWRRIVRLRSHISKTCTEIGVASVEELRMLPQLLPACDLPVRVIGPNSAEKVAALKELKATTRTEAAVQNKIRKDVSDLYRLSFQIQSNLRKLNCELWQTEESIIQKLEGATAETKAETDKSKLKIEDVDVEDYPILMRSNILLTRLIQIDDTCRELKTRKKMKFLIEDGKIVRLDIKDLQLNIQVLEFRISNLKKHIMQHFQTMTVETPQQVQKLTMLLPDWNRPVTVPPSMSPEDQQALREEIAANHRIFKPPT